MIETARRLADAPGSYWTDQLNNTDQVTAYHRMGEEIWAQTGGKVDGFVQSVGTAGSIRGNAKALRRHNDRIRIVDRDVVVLGDDSDEPRVFVAQAHDDHGSAFLGVHVEEETDLPEGGAPASPICSSVFSRGMPASS